MTPARPEETLWIVATSYMMETLPDNPTYILKPAILT